MLDENSIESLETGLSAGITGEEYKEELILVGSKYVLNEYTF